MILDKKKIFLFSFSMERHWPYLGDNYLNKTQKFYHYKFYHYFYHYKDISSDVHYLQLNLDILDVNIDKTLVKLRYIR